MKPPRFQLVAKPVSRLPVPMNSDPWPVGQGPRVWTPERINDLQRANEAYRREKLERRK